MISTLAASSKYGVDSNTLALFIQKFSILKLATEISTQLIAHITDDQKLNLLEKKVKELTITFDYAKLKKDGLEVMIKVNVFYGGCEELAAMVA